MEDYGERPFDWDFEDEELLQKELREIGQKYGRCPHGVSSLDLCYWCRKEWNNTLLEGGDDATKEYPSKFNGEGKKTNRWIARKS